MVRLSSRAWTAARAFLHLDTRSACCQAFGSTWAAFIRTGCLGLVKHNETLALECVKSPGSHLFEGPKRLLHPR